MTSKELNTVNKNEIWESKHYSPILIEIIEDHGRFISYRELISGKNELMAKHLFFQNFSFRGDLNNV